MRAFLVFTLLSLFFETSSAACSVEKGYKIPTNFELVQKATVIVLARVKDVPAAMEPGHPFEQRVTLEPVRFLKGSAPADQIGLMGWRQPGGLSGVPTTTTLSQSHFSTGIGGCVRQFYTPGELVVAMFGPNPNRDQPSGHQLFQLFEPFARAVETVDNPQDVWVHAVEKYVALQSGPPAGLDERIRTAITDLNGIDSPEAQAISADLQYQLTRKDPSDVWGSSSSPISTLAGVIGHPEMGLYCVAGSPPGLMVEGSARTKAELSVAGATYETRLATPVPMEELLASPRFGSNGQEPKKRTLYRFVDGPRLLAALKDAPGPVEIRMDGKSLGAGRPLDALLHWAGQCEKLQGLKVPTEADLRRPAI